jgi:hypothetical protein
MVNLKNMSSKLVSNIVRRIIVILGCLLFVFSFISPFYFVSTRAPGGSSSTYYWSYKCDYYYLVGVGGGSGSSHQWFSNYWFAPYVAIWPPIWPWILISLFIVQILTLVSATVFIVSNRRILSFGPIVLSAAVLVLMTYTGERANEVLPTFFYNVKEYQLGYYLVYLSLAMFLFALLLNEVTKKMQATKPAEENRNILSSSVNIRAGARAISVLENHETQGC